MDLRWEEHFTDSWDSGEKHTWIERRLIIVPGCCEASTKGRTVALRLPHEAIYGFRGKGQADCKPRWVTASVFHYDGEHKLPERQVVTFCPHCGKPMPEIRKRVEVLEPIAQITDGGYHCDTCSERLHACKCWPCEAHWEVVPPSRPDAVLDTFQQDQQRRAIERAKLLQLQMGKRGIAVVNTYPRGAEYPHAIFVTTSLTCFGEGWITGPGDDLVHVRIDPNY